MTDSEIWDDINSKCSVYDLDKPYIRYCEDIITGNILACKDVILACKRFKSWFEKKDRYFDYEDVDRRIRLVSKMKHFRGKVNNQPFILLPYQQFIFAGIFGWKYKSTNYRVTQNVLIFMARKNAKTSLASALCLTQILLDNNNGQEIDFIASSGAQARLGFEMTKNYAQSMDPYGIVFTRYRDTIKMPSTKSEIDVRNSDAMTLDGLNSSTFIADEAHSYKTPDLWHVLKSSQGFQTQPLAICITTAGYLLDGYFLYEWVKTCKDILRGEKEDDTQFSLLYSLDEGDDWADENVWIKSNPGLGPIISLDYLRNECRVAKNQTSMEFGFRTKLMNQFCQSSDTWIPAQYIKDCMQPIDIQDFKDEYCYMGVDLSAVSDLTCWSVCFPPNEFREKYPDKYVFKTFIYVPESTFDESVNKQLYKEWVRHKIVKKTDGNCVDYDTILKDQVDLQDTVNYSLVAYDSWNATQWAINATQAGLPLEPYSQSIGNYNKPTKYLEMLIRSGRCIIDTNMAVLWSFNNVKLKIDYNDNCKPDKATVEAKIDPVISICTSLGGYLSEGGVDVEIV